MKKISMETLVAYINDKNLTDLFEIRDEISAELAKNKAKADANRDLYSEIHDQIMEVLESTTAPVTAQELADETGIAKGKIVYGLTHYWSDEVEKDTSKKSTTYALKHEA